MKKKLGFIFLIACFFVFGFIAWKVLNTGHIKNFSSLQEFNEKIPADLLVVVDKTNITKDDLDFEIKLLTSNPPREEIPLDPNPTPPEVSEAPVQSTSDDSFFREKVLDSLVERTLLYNAVASDKNFNDKDSRRFQACKEEAKEVLKTHNWAKIDLSKLEKIFCQKALIEQYQNEVIFVFGEPTDEEIANYYEEHKKDFQQPERVQIRQIVVSNEVLAHQLRGKVTNSNFSQVAAEHSITPEAKEDGGRLPAYSYNELPSLFNVAFAMAPGHISEVIRSPYGFHIILLENKTKSEVLSFQKARSQINTLLIQNKKQEAYKTWVELAVNSTKIKLVNF